MLAFTSSIPLNLKASFISQKLTPRRPRYVPVRILPKFPKHVIYSVQDHYKILDIPSSADAQTVKRAYRRAALKNHPDVSKASDAREKFLSVQEAYAVLSDPRKRAAYDRRRNVGSGFGSGFDGFPGSAGFGGFDTSEYVKRWRENNPMPTDIDDDLGNIFGDLFSGVADAVRGSDGSGGIAEDFIEFLEKRVDGFGETLGDNDGLREILRSEDVDVLNAEIEDANFVLEQLRSRKSQAEKEEQMLKDRANDWNQRKERAEKSKDFMTRDAARDREQDLRKDADRFAKRAEKTAKHIRKQEERLKKLEIRLGEIKAKKNASSTTSATYSGSQSTSSSQSRRSDTWAAEDKKRKEASINDELEKMKKELGL